MTLGEKIQTLRKQHGMSQEQLSTVLAVSRQAISKWEVDESIPDVDNIVQLSEIFNVTTDSLLKNGAAHFSPPSGGDREPRVTLKTKTLNTAPTHVGKYVVISGIITLVLASVDGVLWWDTANLLFPVAIVAILIGITIIAAQYLGRNVVPLISAFGVRLTSISMLVACVAGVQGFLNRNHSDILISLAFLLICIGHGMFIGGYFRMYFARRKKSLPDVIDLRESDVNQWKN